MGCRTIVRHGHRSRMNITLRTAWAIAIGSAALAVQAEIPQPVKTAASATVRGLEKAQDAVVHAAKLAASGVAYGARKAGEGVHTAAKKIGLPTEPVASQPATPK